MEVIKCYIFVVIGLIGLFIMVLGLTKIIAKTIYEERFNFLIKISEKNNHFNNIK